uniref:Putative secreted protein n=1 Tax=Anopheles marajoara TaxID=58244 RepID=A0A2M4C8V8_9DIPT
MKRRRDAEKHIRTLLLLPPLSSALGVHVVGCGGDASCVCVDGTLLHFVDDDDDDDDDDGDEFTTAQRTPRSISRLSMENKHPLWEGVYTHTHTRTHERH